MSDCETVSRPSCAVANASSTAADTPSKLATLASIALASESVEASMASAIVVADAFASPTWPATSSAEPFAEDRRLAELVMRSCDDVSTVEYVRSTEEALAI